jgi:hypothetical protein
VIGQHDLPFIESEFSHLQKLCRVRDFCLRLFEVGDWEAYLPLSQEPPVFGHENINISAFIWRQNLLEQLVPDMGFIDVDSDRIVYLGGYSLSGLFALWAGYMSMRFRGIAAASPSIWYPGFLEYMRENSMHAQAVYLSLGKKEKRTRNPIMDRAGDAIMQAKEILDRERVHCCLEWNNGNHFTEPDLRMAKAFAWLINEDAVRLINGGGQ